MVNTRRMDSGQSSSRPHRTRNALKLEQNSGASTEKEDEEIDSELSNSDNDDDEDDDNDDTTSDSPLIKLRSRQQKKNVDQSTSSVHKSNYKKKFNDYSLKSDRKSLSLGRNNLAVYAKRKMDPSIEMANGDFLDDDYCLRSSKSNRLKKNRILRRTALSLRPISQKCYIDHYPLHFDTDSDASLIKRRTRKKNLSWLADSQMHKVGYPNLFNGYSEEDSRDAVEHENVEVNSTQIRRTKRRIVKPTYYYEEYEDTNDLSKNRSSKRGGRPKALNVSLDKPVQDEGACKTRRRKTETLKEENDNHNGIGNNLNGDDKESKESDGQKDNTTSTAENVQGVLTQKSSDSSSDSDDDDHKPLQSRIERPRRIRIRKKIVDSSTESEEEGRKYLLRNRQAKPVSQSISIRNERCEIRSRRYTRRRGRGKSSTSDSSSSSDRCGKSSKGQSKNPHAKNEKMKSGGGRNAIVPIKPESLDQSVRFKSIGGLDTHIQCLKDIILLPMMYPEVFKKFQIRPPRGVLFHGPPGTGKTLISRALANECSFGKRKVSFFMRKGADLLSKWIGESEKQLRLLFEQAAEMKPSIIFFDELDGLASVRSSRQDQVHASIVSTLLALMDGLDDRGEVIVIGATNRIDAIDPALRRPGRFDRELYFPLPSKTEREEILKVHVACWSPSPNYDLLTYLAENTVGYCGSDIRALCSEAVINSFRRTYPQIYSSEHKLLLDPEKVQVEKVDFMQAKSMIVPASQRIVSGIGKKLIPILEPLLNDTIIEALNILQPNFPHGFNPALAKVKLSANIRHTQLIITGDGPEHGQTNHIAPALLFKMEHIQAYVIDLTTIHKEPGRTPEEACIQVINEAKRNIPSIIYIPNIDGWWDLISDTLRAIFISQIIAIEPNSPLLFLATSHISYCVLPEEIQKLFSTYRNEIIQIHPPDKTSRLSFFKSLIINTSMQPPRSIRERPKTPPPLPKAPTPPPSPMTEEQAEKLYHTEEHTLRELRIFLRDMCKKLANNKLFFMFTKPVDTDEVPDYTEIIKQPMDLETMMTKVDHHLYECAKDFLSDIDLICQNALEYNPAKSSADKQIRHRACSLRDYAYTLIKTEMDSDFEDKCQDIKSKRKDRNACVSKYLPAYIHTPDVKNVNLTKTTNESTLNDSVISEAEIKGDKSKINEKPIEKNKGHSNRKRKMTWQHGYLKKRKKPKCESSNPDSNKNAKVDNSSDESKENDPDSNSNLDMQNKSKLSESDKSVVETLMTPLSVTCDSQKNQELPNGNMEISPKRRLTDLMSPSELLDSPLYFDDIDQALNENAVGIEPQKKVECSEIELEAVLEQTVDYTDGFSLVNLLDLYNQLNCIIRQHSKTYIRHSLPQKLAEELKRFKRSVE